MSSKRWMQILFFSLFWSGVFGASVQAQSVLREVSDHESLDRLIDLELSGATLKSVVTQMTQRAGMDVLIGLDVARPEEFSGKRLYLEMRNMPVRQCAEWLARALGTRYRLADGGKTLEFTSSYAFLDQIKPVAAFENLGGLTVREETEDFEAFLRELLKIVALRGEDYSFRVDPRRMVLIANLPRPLLRRLKRILVAISTAGRIPQRLVTAAAESRKALEWESLLVDATYDNWALEDILSDLAAQSGVNIGLDHLPLYDHPVRRLSIKLGRTHLEKALAELCSQMKYASIEVDGSYGLWLSRGDSKGEGAFGSRELLWDPLPVEAYRAAALVGRFGENGLISQVRRVLSAEVLLDPNFGFAYHRRSGNLVVVAPRAGQRKIENRLAQLREQMRSASLSGGVR